MQEPTIDTCLLFHGAWAQCCVQQCQGQHWPRRSVCHQWFQVSLLALEFVHKHMYADAAWHMFCKEPNPGFAAVQQFTDASCLMPCLCAPRFTLTDVMCVMLLRFMLLLCVMHDLQYVVSVVNDTLAILLICEASSVGHVCQACTISLMCITQIWTKP